MFEQAIAHVKSTLEADATAGQFTVLRQDEANFDDKLRSTLRDAGLCLAVVGMAGRLRQKEEPLAMIYHEVVVAVISNPSANTSGTSAIALVEAVISAVHQSLLPSEKGLRNTITVDDPAYEIADVDEGPMTYLVNFRYKTVTA